ncbi:hypothetical protein PR048_000611 [Dryococelus australis]|uniref:Uncharacterized protein n=1 Tax=Dryococelus australis TaxID=614101 RepID=A0ABQ9IF54_9NEOP|nr:hypothetical protein PR048_000611 [Dryococelus australis]
MEYKIDRRKHDRFCRTTSNFRLEMISILRRVVRHDAQSASYLQAQSSESSLHLQWTSRVFTARDDSRMATAVRDECRENKIYTSAALTMSWSPPRFTIRTEPCPGPCHGQSPTTMGPHHTSQLAAARLGLCTEPRASPWEGPHLHCRSSELSSKLPLSQWEFATVFPYSSGKVHRGMANRKFHHCTAFRTTSVPLAAVAKTHHGGGLGKQRFKFFDFSKKLEINNYSHDCPSKKRVCRQLLPYVTYVIMYLAHMTRTRSKAADTQLSRHILVKRRTRNTSNHERWCPRFLVLIFPAASLSRVRFRAGDKSPRNAHSTLTHIDRGARLPSHSIAPNRRWDQTTASSRRSRFDSWQVLWSRLRFLWSIIRCPLSGAQQHLTVCFVMPHLRSYATYDVTKRATISTQTDARILAEKAARILRGQTI